MKKAFLKEAMPCSSSLGMAHAAECAIRGRRKAGKTWSESEAIP